MEIEIINFRIMKKKLTRILKNNILFLNIYNLFFRILNKRSFFNAIETRKNQMIFDYIKLSKELPFYPDAEVKDSNFYGHYKWLKEYTNLNKIDFAIEHGLYLGSHVPIATHLKTTKAVITFSKNRKYHLENAGITKPIISIGPYIHYAKPLIEKEKFNEIKEDFGNILTVFPSHSIQGFNVNIDHNFLLDEIDRIKSKGNYDSVFICAYYKDIQDNNFIKSYEERNHNIVTAGHKNDVNFLARLKSIIQLSDFTMSNTVGTHTGYCIYLNKPHYIFNQDIQYTDKDGRISKEYRLSHEVEQLQLEKEEILSFFKEYYSVVTQNQRIVVDKYWGTSEIKSKEDLKFKILNK